MSEQYFATIYYTLASEFNWTYKQIGKSNFSDVINLIGEIERAKKNQLKEKLFDFLRLINVVHGAPKEVLDQILKEINSLDSNYGYDDEVGDIQGIESLVNKRNRYKQGAVMRGDG